jgi:predicted HAD superfamily Cof-like phosphohydrolase
MQLMQDLTANFMKTFGQWDGLTYLSIPKPKDEAELSIYKLRLKLCVEETFELFEAMLTTDAYQPFDKMLSDINSYIEQITLEQLNIDPVSIYDSLLDQEVVNHGFANLLGLDMNEGMKEVYRSNMSKLGKDGKPIYREDGKVMKSELYSPPDLLSIYNKTKYTFTG